MRTKRWVKDVMHGLMVFGICAAVILTVSAAVDNIWAKQHAVTVSKDVNSNLDCDQNLCNSSDTTGYKSGYGYEDNNGELTSLTNGKNIVCWGDSITYGLGGQDDTYIVHGDEVIDASGWAYTDVLKYRTGMNVYNLGVCGETSYDIALRQGGIKMYVGKQVTVKPGTKTKVSIVDEYGNPAILENFNGYQTDNDEPYNVVYINDTAFQLEESDDGSIYISLYDESITKSVKIKKGSQVITKAAHDMSADIVIIQMGSNGGWDDYDELIEQYKAIIANSGTECYIIIGDTDNPDESIDSANYESSAEVGTDDTLWEAALREAFGEHFINMRTYMLENGLEVAGLETTDDDIDDLADGRVPESLKYDYTHLNSYGYYVIGQGVYEKGVELGYW